MSEARRGYEKATQSEKEIADKLVAVVEWLAWVEKDDDYEGSASRLGYYEADHEGPLQYGDVYFGKIIGYDEDTVIHHHQIYLLPPEVSIGENGFWGMKPLDINVSSDGTVVVNDEQYERMPTYVEKTVDHFLGWMAMANMRHTQKTDQL